MPQGVAVVVEKAAFRRVPGRGADVLRQDQLQLPVVPVHLDGVEGLVKYRPRPKVSAMRQFTSMLESSKNHFTYFIENMPLKIAFCTTQKHQKQYILQSEGHDCYENS